jgi:glycyl-tRNA synthetase beta chain
MSGPEMPLLVEVGCEEIPARFLRAAESDFCRLLGDALVEQGLSAAPPQVSAYYTPRRLVAHVPALLAKQPDLVEEVTGPPIKVAFDAEGKPTRAAESFASKNGVTIEELLQVQTPKGLYLGARKTILGQPAEDVLAALLPGVIKSMTFPKSMVWESTGTRFVRPIRWLLALLGEGDDARAVRFEIAGVVSGKCTLGHRASASQFIVVEGFTDYAQKLRHNFVEFDSESRHQSVRTECNVLLEDWMEIVPDEELEIWVVNSTEWPTGLRGGFNERFLRLPREILVTVMRNHQKYFAVEDREGHLLPYFVTLLNRDRDASGMIQAGHERVLTARFSDAEFFWNADQKTPLRDRAPMLERVTYQAKLGSYGDKVRRMQAIAEQVCAELEAQGKLTSDQRAHALRAVELCKCDLTTQMVQEFTELQGVVGGLYAQAQGEPQEVSQAIYDHYKPVNIEDECPRSVAGAVVSLSDKLDAVMAGFSVGLEPTGSSDPFGLRRAGNGVVKIAVEVLPGTNLHDLTSKAIEMGLGLAHVEPLFGSITSFLGERTEYYLHAVGGLRLDTVRALRGRPAGLRVPSEVLQIGVALEPFLETDDFRALATASKRIRNILTKSAKLTPLAQGAPIYEELLDQGPQEERDLYKAFRAAYADLDQLKAQSDYSAAFRRVAELRPAVDRFFDKVLVMDPDAGVQANRLRLLLRLNALISRFADLSEIEAAAPDKS